MIPSAHHLNQYFRDVRGVGDRAGLEAGAGLPSLLYTHVRSFVLAPLPLLKRSGLSKNVLLHGLNRHSETTLYLLEGLVER